MNTARDAITWWGCADFELNFNGRILVVDPVIHPTEPRANYICITHNDFDHCHEPTLQTLTAGPAFQRLIVSPSCPVNSKLDSPIPAGAPKDLAYVSPDRLTVMYPKYTREPGRTYPGPTEMDLEGFRVEAIDSSERPQRYKLHPDALFPDGTGPYVGDGQYPNLGYVITETGGGTTFYHPGDLHEVFDAHRELRGRIDYLFFPIPKMPGQEVTLIDAVRPKAIIPMHYWLDTPDFPIPWHFSKDDLTVADFYSAHPTPGADAEIYKHDLELMNVGHFYPTTPPPPLERISSLAPSLKKLGTDLIILEPGRPYELADLDALRARPS